MLLLHNFTKTGTATIKTFKKLINIDLNKFVKISSNINFFEDLSYSNCLISFSSTSIEETLFLNKKVLVYFGNREYKHINYKFKEDSDIVYSDQKDIKYKLNIILSDRNKKDYDILWGEKIDIEDDLKKFYF